MSKKKILLYYHHFGGLGHGMRIYAICRSIKNLFPQNEIFVINSGRPQPELGLQKFTHILNLPAFEAKVGLFSGLISSDGANDDAFRRRMMLLSMVAKRIKPDIVIFEHFPFGRIELKKEILSFIRILRQNEIPVYSSVRDIIDQKIDVPGLLQTLRLFKAVFVHTDKDSGFITDFRQPYQLRRKIIFTGRIVPFEKDNLTLPLKIRRRLKCVRKKLILVNIGGGIDGYKIIEKIIEMARSFMKQECFFLISTGPAIKEAEFLRLNKEAKNIQNIKIVKFLHDCPSHINAADLYISMGGYNSVNNALSLQKKSLIFPRNSDNEQKIRVKVFHSFLREGKYKDKVNTLASQIEAVLNKEAKLRYKGGFGGSKITARLIQAVLNLESIKVRLTTKCNASCSMCSWRKQAWELDYARVKKLIQDASLTNIKIFNFTGGEPTLYPHFLDALSLARKSGFRVAVSSNGIVERAVLTRMAKLVEIVDISLDSYDASINDSIRGRSGGFQSAYKTMQYLFNNRIAIHLNVTVRPDNFRGINKMVSFASPFIKSISFTLCDTTQNNFKSLIFSKEELEYFYFSEIPLIIKECVRNKLRWTITPFFNGLSGDNKRNRQIVDFLKNSDDYRKRFKSVFRPKAQPSCLIAKKSLRISANGTVSPCCYLDDSWKILDLGNIKSGLLQILSSEKYHNFIDSARPGNGLCGSCMQGYSRYAE